MKQEFNSSDKNKTAQNICTCDIFKYINLRSLQLFILIVFISSVSCEHRNIQMFTKINPDGSCYREITVKYDSAFLAGDTANNPFPVRPDTSWLLVLNSETGNKDLIHKYIPGKIYPIDTSLNKTITIRKIFPVVNNLSGFKFRYTGWDTLQTKVTFDKKFKWFYTYYTFNETYPKINPFNKVPISNYLNEEEISTLYGENNSLYKGKNGIEIKDLLNTLEEKGNAWLSRNYYELFYRVILENYRYYKHFPVDSATFANARDKVYKLNKDSLKTDNVDFEEILNQYFHTKAFTDMENPKEVEKALKKEIPEFENYFRMDINYVLSIPGKIIETNSVQPDSTTLKWKIDAYRFFFTDYTVHVKSRIPNKWAFIVTGLFILIVFASFWVKKK